MASHDGGVEDEDRPPYVPQRRLIHFDLKGAPPKMEYLIKVGKKSTITIQCDNNSNLNLFCQVLRLSKSLGATGVLLEYEDMFPFEGNLAKVAAENHYSKEEVMTLIAECDDLELEVIPLVQTFGESTKLLKLNRSRKRHHRAQATWNSYSSFPSSPT